MRIRVRIQNSTVWASFSLLSPKDKSKIYLIAIVQAGLGFLDLAGVAVLGVLGALSVTGIQSKQPGNRVGEILRLLHLTQNSFQVQVAVLGAIAVILLLGRTVLSIFFMRRTLFFLSHRGAKASSDLIAKVLTQPLLEIQGKTSQETLWAVTNGVSSIMLGILGIGINMVADFSLLIVITLGLFLVDPIMAIGMVIIFSSAAFILYLLLHKRAQKLGTLHWKLNISSNEKILEILHTYRESVVRNRREYYAREISKLRMSLGDVLAENSFMPYIGKYVIESTVLVGALCLGVFQFITNDASRAVATMVIFIAAGSRIGPAILRIQQGSITVKGSLGSAKPTLDLIARVRDAKPLSVSSDQPNFDREGFTGSVELDKVSFRYPNASRNAVEDASVQISHGKFAAIVGSSGAGKTTLVDILLGIIHPDSGNIKVSSLSPEDVIVKWPGAIAYVPQDVAIINGSIRENVGLGFSDQAVDDEMVWKALKVAQLDNFVKELPEMLNTGVGERGTRISGGQRQRLGIARAMFTNPQLLILDEATSALDGQTESDISEAIQNLKGQVTVIMIAHRLSTVRNADMVVYLNEGKIIATGTFDEVRKAVPDFDRQAQLMGL
jgi:ABC-type multidrug transport system fused ATPase/permease subunit